MPIIVRILWGCGGQRERVKRIELSSTLSGFFPFVSFNKGIDLDRAPRSPRLFLFRAGATIRSKRKGWLSVGLRAAAKGYALDAAPCLATTSAHTLRKDFAKFFATLAEALEKWLP